jgi:hypothetical protein
MPARSSSTPRRSTRTPDAIPGTSPKLHPSRLINAVMQVIRAERGLRPRSSRSTESPRPSKSDPEARSIRARAGVAASQASGHNSSIVTAGGLSARPKPDSARTYWPGPPAPGRARARGPGAACSRAGHPRAGRDDPHSRLICRHVGSLLVTARDIVGAPGSSRPGTPGGRGTWRRAAACCWPTASWSSASTRWPAMRFVASSCTADSCATTRGSTCRARRSRPPR